MRVKLALAVPIAVASTFLLGRVGAAPVDHWLSARRDPTRTASASSPTPGFPLALKWKVQLEGSVSAGAIVNDDLVFIGSDAKKFWALSRATGTVKWVYTSPDAIKLEASVSPSGDPTRVYFVNEGGGLVALNATTGAELWTVESTATFLSPPTYLGGRVRIPDGPGR